MKAKIDNILPFEIALPVELNKQVKAREQSAAASYLFAKRKTSSTVTPIVTIPSKESTPPASIPQIKIDSNQENSIMLESNWFEDEQSDTYSKDKIQFAKDLADFFRNSVNNAIQYPFITAIEVFQDTNKDIAKAFMKVYEAQPNNAQSTAIIAANVMVETSNAISAAPGAFFNQVAFSNHNQGNLQKVLELVKNNPEMSEKIRQYSKNIDNHTVLSSDYNIKTDGNAFNL